VSGCRDTIKGRRSTGDRADRQGAQQPGGNTLIYLVDERDRYWASDRQEACNGSSTYSRLVAACMAWTTKMQSDQQGKGRTGLAAQSASRVAEAGELEFFDFAELNHRIRNEYSRIIAMASRLSAKSGSKETKDALDVMIAQLCSVAEVHQVLRPPLGAGTTDLTASVERLCRALLASPEMRNSGTKLSLSFTDAVLVDARRCWRVILIVAELIENARRHALGFRARSIRIALAQTEELILCRVSDDGETTAPFKVGLGTRLLDQLATELGGNVDRRSGRTGTTVTLSLPR
jgi:two-component sensor histidine kinase